MTKVYELLLGRTDGGYRYVDFVRTRQPLGEEGHEILLLISKKELDRVVESMIADYFSDCMESCSDFFITAIVTYDEENETFELKEVRYGI